MKNFLLIGVLAAVITMPVVAQETPIRNSTDSSTRTHVADKKAQHDKKTKAQKTLKKHKKHKKGKKRSAASEN